jgi:hypothetical protein
VSLDDEFLAAVSSHRGTEAANQLCKACVAQLGVDAAAISLTHDGSNAATLGASSAAARRYDEVQFLVGEGPCLDAGTHRHLIVVPDLDDPAETRWPLYRPTMRALQIRAVTAAPVLLSGRGVGALNLFQVRAAPLSAQQLRGALLAAQIAELPLLDVLRQQAAPTADPEAWTELHTMTRTEVDQATGMLMVQLDIGPTAALARLRAHAYATNLSPTHIARAIIGRRLRLDPS